MGLVADLRVLVRDNSVDVAEQSYTDAELTVFIQQSLFEINVRADVAYTIVSLENEITASPSATNQAVYNLTLQLAEVRVMYALGNDHEKLMKFITQDVTTDPSSANNILGRVLADRQKQFEHSFRKMIGGDWGSWAGYVESEETEVQ